jgi:hypothetical protein
MRIRPYVYIRDPGSQFIIRNKDGDSLSLDSPGIE